MDYSLLFIKARVTKQNSPLRRMPALVFQKDKNQLEIREIDDRNLIEIMRKRSNRKSHQVDSSANFMVKYLDQMNSLKESWLEEQSLVKGN